MFELHPVNIIGLIARYGEPQNVRTRRYGEPQYNRTRLYGQPKNVWTGEIGGQGAKESEENLTMSQLDVVEGARDGEMEKKYKEWRELEEPPERTSNHDAQR